MLLSAKAAHGTHEAWHGLTEWCQTIPLEPFLSRNMCAHIDKDTHTQTHTHTHIYIIIYICIYSNICIYIYVCNCTCTHTHTYR